MGTLFLPCKKRNEKLEINLPECKKLCLEEIKTCQSLKMTENRQKWEV
jgi:hypothetical protein